MPRPKNGYVNAAGLPVPGTGDINGRFMNRSRLLYWAFNRGKQGCAKLYDNSAIDIGTAVHTMAELDLKGQPMEDIEFYARNTLTDADDLAKAMTSFRAFRTWREQFHVKPHIQEASLVSEKYQYGGTLDTIAVIRNGLGLLEFKTSADVYEDHLLQMAAYGMLWEETHPNEPLASGSHLILLPKDGSKPVHREFTREQLKPFRKKFKLYRKAFDLEDACNDTKLLKGAIVSPSITPEATAKKPAKAERAAKPKVVTAANAHLLSMGELLRAYGHVGEGASA